MTDATPETHVNGTAPAADPAAGAEPCLDCASPSEKIMAVFAALLGAFVIVMAIDMFTGGRVTGFIQERVPQ